MGKLKLSDWAAIAEVVGAVAIVVSLIYVATELRHNTEATQAATFQQLVALSSNSLMAIAQDPVLADIYERGIQDSESLANDELFRFFLLIRIQWRGMEAAFFQWRHGVLGDSEWLGYASLMCNELSALTGQQVSWEFHRDSLSPDFVSFIEECR